MTIWNWLTHPQRRDSWAFVGRVLAKALVLFIALNLLFAWLVPLPLLGRLSAYNILLPGRLRLPYGENPARSYNLSLNSIDAMFASHEVARPKADDEFRVLVIGDSSMWGVLLRPEETLAGMLDAAGLVLDDGRQVRVYNLGYPIMSLTKDLLLLDEAMRYDPDLVIWPVTLESFPLEKQLFPPLVQYNTDRVRSLIMAYELPLDPGDPALVDPDFWGRTLVGQRRALADWVRLQVYGVMWATTGIDQFYPAEYTPRQEDFEADLSFHDFTEPQGFGTDDLALEVLLAGATRVGDVPLLVINEPIFISDGQNSDLRYNFFYPRWAYDSYRDLLQQTAQAEGWLYLDLWDVVDASEFTDTAVHYTPAGSVSLAERLGPVILSIAQTGSLP